MTDLSTWTPRPRPERVTLTGRHVELQPLDAERHAHDLFAASSVADAGERFRWLFEQPANDEIGFQAWMEKAAVSEDPLFFAVVDRKTGKVVGRQTLMRIDPTHGVIEIGNIYWGPELARTPGATEALYLFAAHVFDALGYRRFEWKCNNRNEPSRRAAERFGFTFEGIFRQHMIVKGENRDTAWYAMLDSEWPTLKQAFEAWLDDGNFDADGRQRKRLEEFRTA